MLFSWAACNQLKLKAADVSNAYFQAKPLDRLILLKPPPGGLPGEGDLTDAAVVARVPIYGFRDAGRNFWKQLREVIQKAGLKPNKIIKALYSLSEDGDCKVMLATHVDDICFACKPGYEHRVKEILDFFDIRKEEETEFRFCGREIKQDADGSISVTCKDISEKITPVNFRVNGRKPTDKGTQGEIAQVRSVVGSLSWVARQCRPELSYSCSKLQSVAPSIDVAQLEETNKIVQEAQANSENGLFYKAKAFDWNDCIIATVTDASWAGETLIIDDKVFPRKSQMGYVILLADKKLWDADEASVMPICWKSTLIKRTCRSTMQAETHAELGGTECAARLRAAYADLRGLLDIKKWEATSADAIKHLWLTDCNSLESYLKNPASAGCEDKRLEVDLEGLRQLLWENRDGSLKEQLEDNQQDKVRWIDTSTMIADPLTKLMKPTRLIKCLQSGVLFLEPTKEAQMSKLMKKAQRAAKKEKAE